MQKILSGMIDTMNSVKPPRMTALRELRESEQGDPFAILIGTILSARTKDENTARVVKSLFLRYKNAKELSTAKVKDVEKIIPEVVYLANNEDKAIAYDNLIAVIIEAIKEISVRLKKLEEKINI